MRLNNLMAAITLSTASLSLPAAEFKVGEPVLQHGMEVQVLYIQAVTMSAEPEDMVDRGEGASAKESQSANSNQGMNHQGMKMDGDHQAAMPQGGHGGHGNHGGPADIHLEASIKALADNAWGFAEGSWIPYLNIRYSVVKNGSFFKARGRLIPMASNGGPHYGANIKLDGPGKYYVTYRIAPPQGSEFPYHTDAETGVAGWWPAFEIKDGFTYLGVGKKGGY